MYDFEKIRRIRKDRFTGLSSPDYSEIVFCLVMCFVFFVTVYGLIK